MGNARGVRRDFEALEQRRLEGLRLLRKGFNQSEVARRLKVCSQTVSRWAKTVSEKGEKGLKAAGRAGRKPLLDVKQRARLTARLLEGPEKLGYETPLWTCPRGRSDWAGVRHSVSCRPCLEVAPPTGLESPTARWASTGAQRRSHWRMEAQDMAGD